MSFWSSVIFSVVLMAVAAGLIFWHFRQWRIVQSKTLSKEEHDFRRRQFRRRIQTSAMLGMAGASILVPEFLPAEVTGSLYFLIYWGAVLLLILWVVLLAAVDVWATKFYYDRLQESYLQEKLNLEAELQRVQAAGSNGKPQKPA